jgi:hypothetical protein
VPPPVTFTTVVGAALGPPFAKVTPGKAAELVFVTVKAGLEVVPATPSLSPIFTEPEKLALGLLLVVYCTVMVCPGRMGIAVLGAVGTGAKPPPLMEASKLEPPPVNAPTVT